MKPYRTRKDYATPEVAREKKIEVERHKNKDRTRKIQNIGRGRVDRKHMGTPEGAMQE